MTYRRYPAEDMAYDSHDKACYFVDEVATHSAVQNRVPGGASLPLTAQTGGVDQDQPGGYMVRGPFGGTAAVLYGQTTGYYGASAALDCPNTVHLSYCFCPAHYVQPTGSGNDMLMVGRTRVTPATAVASPVSVGEFAIATGGRVSAGPGDGGSDQFYRHHVSSVNVAGTLRTLDLQGDTQSLLNMHVLAHDQWHLIDVVRDDATGVIMVYKNGLPRPTASFMGAVQGTGTGTGYWFVGQPKGGGVNVFGMPGRIARFRIMDVNRGQDWIRERHRRMMQSLGG